MVTGRSFTLSGVFSRAAFSAASSPESPRHLGSALDFRATTVPEPIPANSGTAGFFPMRVLPERVDLRPVNALFRGAGRPDPNPRQDGFVSAMASQVARLPRDFSEADLVPIFWKIGQELRARTPDAYGLSAVVADRLSRQLRRGMERIFAERKDSGIDLAAWFTRDNLEKMLRLAQAFPQSYVQRLLPRLNLQRETWRMFAELARIDDPYERFFYAEMCFHNQWTLTRLRKEVSQNRFHTYTIARQSDQRLREALIELSQGNRRNWIYRDLVRFDFLKLSVEEFDGMTEPAFENLMIQNVMAVLDEFGSGFRLEDRQKIIRYVDPDDPSKTVKEIRLDLVMNVEETQDARGAYPLIVELKKVPFGKAVLNQCEDYRRIFEIKDESGPLFNQTGRESRVMAFVPKANTDYIDLMRLGLYGDGNINPIFVSVYTYNKPSAEFLHKVIGEQLDRSAGRAEEFKQHLWKAGEEPNGRFYREGDWLYSSLFFLDAGKSDAPEQLPF